MSTRVMIVDDAAFMRHMIKGILTGMGCEIVAEAVDGNDACEKYGEVKPDLVTLDLIMPNRGGLDTLKEIRANRHDRLLFQRCVDGNSKAIPARLIP